MPPEYPERLHELCRRHGMLWVGDEVQSGVGRTGTMWAIKQYPGAEPDLTVFGKSIGGGLPLAGVTGGADVMNSVPAGGLGGTLGGNPLSCAAALAVLDLVSDPQFLAGARQLGVVAPRSSRRARLEGARRSVRCAASARCSPSSSSSGRPSVPRPSSSGGVRAGPGPFSCGLYGNVIRLLPPLIDRGTTSSTKAWRSWRSRLGPDPPGAAPDVSVRGLRKTLRRRRRGRRGRPRHRRRRVLHDARAVGLGEDHDAAHDRRLRDAQRRHDPARRRGRVAAPAVRPAREHGLPGLRALSAHDRSGRTSSTG